MPISSKASSTTKSPRSRAKAPQIKAPQAKVLQPGGPQAKAPQRKAFITVIRGLEKVESPDTMKVVVATLKHVLPKTSGDPATKGVLRASNTLLEMNAAGVVRKHEKNQLEFNALRRAFAMRRSLLEDTVTASEAGILLGISRQAANERARKGQLLAIREAGVLRFPLWQFDPAGPDGVVTNFSEVLRVFDEIAPVSPLLKISWLSHKNRELGGQTPVAALKAGQQDQVIAALRGATAW